MPTITGELRRHFRGDTTWAVHVPRRAKDLQHTVKVAVNELGQMLGRSPTVDEIAGHGGVPVEEVLEALEAARCYRKTPWPPPAMTVRWTTSPLGGLDGALDAVDATATVAVRRRATARRAAIVEEPAQGRRLTQSQIADLVGVSQVQGFALRASLAKLRGTLADVAGTRAR